MPSPPPLVTPAPVIPPPAPTPSPLPISAPQNVPLEEDNTCCSDLPQWENKLREMIWKSVQNPAALADADSLTAFLKELGVTMMEEMDFLTVDELYKVINCFKPIKQRIVKKAIADAKA